MAFSGGEPEILDIRSMAEVREATAQKLVGQSLKVLCGRRHCCCVGGGL